MPMATYRPEHCHRSLLLLRVCPVTSTFIRPDLVATSSSADSEEAETPEICDLPGVTQLLWSVLTAVHFFTIFFPSEALN